jgi:hypothetical protein
MTRMPSVSALVLGLTITASITTVTTALGVAPAAAHRYPIALDHCAPGYDRCMATCEVSMWTGAPPPWPLGRCNDYCAQGTNICDAMRMPRRSGYKTH